MTSLERWREARRLDQPIAPLLMGVVNVTPDSFFDGGEFASHDAALSRALQLVEEGADYIDIGGESTRPGAKVVSVTEELQRVLPVIEGLRQRSDVAISIDTSRVEVMDAACAAGACLINDVRALQSTGAYDVAIHHDVDVCLMHMRGAPATMQSEPHYDDVGSEVQSFLSQRRDACVAAGIQATRILVDPGIGFGKLLEHNLALLRALPDWSRNGQQVVLGVSRKSMLGEISVQPSVRRLYGGLAVAYHAAVAGVTVLRVHDVAATRETLQVWSAIHGVVRTE